MFYFKTGGLNDLIHIFRSWKYFNHVCHKQSHQHTFTIFRPKLSLAELHPEEKNITSLLTEDMWRDLKDPDGRISEGPFVLKVSFRQSNDTMFYEITCGHIQVIFFQGMKPELRKEVWPFLLGLYQFDSSERERLRIRHKRHEEYRAIDKRR